MNFFQKLQSLIRSIIRSWIMLSLNQRWLAAILLAAAFGIYLAALYTGNASLLASLPVALFGIIAGMFFASGSFRKFIERAKALIEEEVVTEINSPGAGTGLSLLDEALNEAWQKNKSLLQTIETMEEKNTTLIERYQVLTENLAAAVVIRDTEGTILYCSPYTEKLTGYSLDDIYAHEGDFFETIVHPEDLEDYKRSVRVSTAGGEAFGFRYRFVHAGNIEMWAETRIMPLFDRDENVVSSLSITLDVTRSVRDQKQLEEKNRDLEDFAYMISHDLKSPIHTIRGMVNIIEEDFLEGTDGDLREMIEHIGGASKRLEELVSSVLEYSRITRQDAPLTRVDLNEVLKDVVHDFSPQLNEAEGSITVQDDLPTVSGDRIKLYQIFSNLVGNAIKYRSPGRSLAIAVKQLPTDNPRFVCVAVQDNGLGIPEDQRELVFRPFQRIHKDKAEGSGIGLACVKKLVEKMDGAVKIVSSATTGSDFQILLKIA